MRPVALSAVLAAIGFAAQAAAPASTVPATRTQAPAPAPAPPTAVVVQAVQHCLDQVHAFVPPPGAEVYSGHEWANFDAYYNPVTQRVMDNVTMTDGSQPRFLFYKCLTALGFSTTE